MHLLDRQRGVVHLSAAKEVLLHGTKPVIKTRTTKMIPQSQWYSGSGANVSRAGSRQLRNAKVRSEMGKGVGELGGKPFEVWIRTCKRWRRCI